MTIINSVEFGRQLVAAGLAGLPFSWGADGALTFGEDITPQQRADIEALAAAHDPLAGDKAGRWALIKAERDRRIQTGGYKIGSKWFHSDTFSRTQQMGLVMLGANIPANTPWKTMDGTTVIMTQALAGQIFSAAAASDIAIFAAAEAHRVAMEASGDPAAYDFTGNWPPIYGEPV